MYSSSIITGEEFRELKKLRGRILSERSRRVLHVNTEVRKLLRDFFIDEGFFELSPVIIGPVTDPLNHPVSSSSIDYYGYRYSLTQSMIFHKQIALLSYHKLFIFSPNVRLEPIERSSTGRHLAEFTQLDVEIKGATRDEVIALAERMYCYVIERISVSCKDDFEYFGRLPSVPQRPFRQFDFSEAKLRFGESFETVLSKDALDPFFVVDIGLKDREFYDREKPDRPGILNDMDMIYPEGYGEALSGGERENEVTRIKERIQIKGQTVEQFRYYIAMAEMGLPRSAGFGIGIERFVRFLTGIGDISECTLFPRVIGKFSL